MRAPTKTIDFSDLVGLPYEIGGSSRSGCDCVGVGSLALHRMDAPLEPGDLPLTEADLWLSLQALSEDSAESPWVLVGTTTDAAKRLGDIILSETADGSHVGVLVDESRRIVLTACAPLYREEEDPRADPDEDGERPLRTVLAREGQTFACAARRVRGCQGVYRLRRWGEAR